MAKPHRRREGFVVVTGNIGTGKTTLCRLLLEEIDRKERVESPNGKVIFFPDASIKRP